MEQVLTKTNNKEHFIALAERRQAKDSASQSALRAFQSSEFPTTRQEDWRYTRTSRITNEKWILSDIHPKPDIQPFLIPGLNTKTVILVDGVYSHDLSQWSDEDGISLKHGLELRKPSENYSDIFETMVAAICTSHLELNISDLIQSEKSIHFIHIVCSDLILAQPSILVKTGKSSSVHIVESFVSVSNKKSFTNRLFKAEVGKNASLKIDKIQMETDEHFLLNNEDISVGQDGRLTINTISIDGGWIRNQLNIELAGQNIEANLSGVYLPRNKQFVDNHTRVDHQFPNCHSNELYKGLLDGQSTGVFNGKVYVRPDAQKTNAFQNNANILLSPDAQMNTKPELEIYADDVKCSHGSTTGQIDDNAMFYLRSRGLDSESAMKMMATAFISDVLNKIDNDSVRTFVINELTKRRLLYV